MSSYGSCTEANLPNRYSTLRWRPVTHAQTWASYSALYQFGRLSCTDSEFFPFFLYSYWYSPTNSPHRTWQSRLLDPVKFHKKCAAYPSLAFKKKCWKDHHDGRDCADHDRFSTNDRRRRVRTSPALHMAVASKRCREFWSPSLVRRRQLIP